MRKTAIIILMMMVGVILFGCEDERDVIYVEVDNPPVAPQGVYSVTGDGLITLYWLSVREPDVDFYRVWWSNTANGDYRVFGTTSETYFVDDDVENGRTYYYAITAVDLNDNESELSYENVYDTPRPEDFNQNLSDFVQFPDDAGFDLSAGQVVPYNGAAADFYIDYDPLHESFFLNVADTLTDIQDMGYTFDFDEITYAPSDGWSYVGWSEVIEGHTYIIWTRDDHFAKIRVTYADYDNQDNILFDWAYQTSDVDPGRMELSRPVKDGFVLRSEIKERDMILIR